MGNKRHMKLLSVLKATVLIIVMAMIFYAGTFVGEAGKEQHVNANVNTNFNPGVEVRVVETRIIQYVDAPAVEANIVEPVQAVANVNNTPAELRNFNTLAELQTWIENRKLATTIFFQEVDTAVDCDNFAAALQQDAIKDGYLVSFQIILPAEYNTLFQNSKLPADTLHAINLAIVGNNVYFIEPQTGEIVHAANLD